MRIVRFRDAPRKVGYTSRTSIYAKLNPKSRSFDPTFPRPISLGPRAMGFVEGELDAWIDSRRTKDRGRNGGG
jgi:prophage regulatory protein